MTGTNLRQPRLSRCCTERAGARFQGRESYGDAVSVRLQLCDAGRQLLALAWRAPAPLAASSVVKRTCAMTELAMLDGGSWSIAAPLSTNVHRHVRLLPIRPRPLADSSPAGSQPWTRARASHMAPEVRHRARPMMAAIQLAPKHSLAEKSPALWATARHCQT